MGKLSKIFFSLSGLSLVSFAIVRFLLGAWVPFLWLALGLFAGFFLAALWVDRRFYKELLTMKTTKQGMSMGAMTAIVLILVIAVNFIAVRKYWTFDFSLAKLNTLSDQSIKLVKGLKEDLNVIYFYKEGTEGVESLKHTFTDLIRRYQDQNEHVKLQFVEVNERPDLAEKYDVKQGTQVVVLDYHGRQSRIEKADEQELTSGIVKVTREKDKKVYVLTGHAELPLEASKDGSSVSLLKELLTSNRYTVSEFSFTKSAFVPADADVLFIIGPRMNFLDVEVKALEDFLRKGGSLILALSTGFKTGLEPLLKNIGVQAKNDYIASVVQVPNMGIAVDPRYARGSIFSATHPITKPFGGNQFTVFRLPTALLKTEKAPAGQTLDEIVKTGDNSMGFPDTKFKNEGEKGPFTVAMAIKGKYDSAATQETNIVVFGGANFLNDQYLYQNLNRDLALNSVSFLAKEDNLISITPKEVDVSQLSISQTQFVLFIFGFIIPLPILFFISGGFIWYRRRYS
jgi:ABC-type uncharacterized transport system involved in gliding motility auxiliary subunit